MSLNRIQKLLFSEYCEFEDMVLVESPFAETTRDGKGIRQVHLGLTPTKLIMATDVIPSAKESEAWCLQEVDPDIETFELISVYPVDCVNLSIFRRKKRQSLKAHFCNNRVVYFELGGFEKKKMFWNLWCERVKFLSPDELFSSRSETSVGSSSSNSTLYLTKANTVFPSNGTAQVWCTFEMGDPNSGEMRNKWTERDLFLGNRIQELSPRYFLPLEGDSITLYENKGSKNQLLDPNRNRARAGHDARLITLSKDSIDILNITTSESVVESIEQTLHKIELPHTSPMLTGTIIEVAESILQKWEMESTIKIANFRKSRHRRRYGFAPQSHFLCGLGPWSVPSGERYSVQLKRAVSAVRIQRQPNESSLRLPVSKRQLSSSISFETLINQPKSSNSILVNVSQDRIPRPLILFWTPEFWYRPRSAHDAYEELQEHLRKIRQHYQEKNYKASKRSKFFGKLQKKSLASLLRLDNGDNQKHDPNGRYDTMVPKETSVQYLRRMLHLDIPLTVWDFDSTTLAYQLTMIDRDLFLKITKLELGIIVWQHSSKNAPNITAIIAFSHRISCLVCTEILKEEVEQVRARLITRYITAADKCNKIFNFQSCKSILCGLQSPACYRLRKTWNYVRKKHPSKYQIFEQLCRIHRDPRLPNYQRAFYRAKKNAPYLPYIGDVLFFLIDKVPVMSAESLSKTSINKLNTNYPLHQIQTISNLQSQKSYSSENSSLPNILRRFLSAFRIWPTQSDLSNLDADFENKKIVRRVSHKIVHWKEQKPRDLDIINQSEKYFDLAIINYEDNREIRFNNMCELLDIFQKATGNYALCTSELANEYLLKARYREDRENFFQSFSIEP